MKHSVLSKQAVARKKKRKKKRDASILHLVGGVVTVVYKSILILMIPAAVSIILLYGYHVTRTSTFIRLEKVEVKGVDPHTRRQLIEMCDFKPGATLLSFRSKRVKRTMEAHPWIRSIELNRSFPHTLVVRAEKQRPAAIVLGNGFFHYVNKNGDIFKKVEDSEDVDFPVITGVPEKNRGNRLDRALEVIKTLERQKAPWCLENLSEINFSDENMSLYFIHFQAKITAESGALARKLPGLEKVIAHLKEKGRIHLVTSIDLNSIDGAVVSFKKG